MKAMIMAAGLGTRLKPITEKIPKALVEFQGKTLLEHAINHLEQYGVDQIIINIHHFPHQILDFLQNKKFTAEITVSDESQELLETGGGLKKAAWFFNDGMPFIVRNVDVISDLDLSELLKSHKKFSAMATLAVRRRETSRYFLFDKDYHLCGWKNITTGETRWSGEPCSSFEMLAFSGIQVIDPAIFPLTETGKFSLTELYLRLAKDQVICGYEEKNKLWMDIGKPQNLNIS